MQVEYLCADSNTVYLFAEDDEQLDKALEVRARVPKLRKIIVFDMDGLRDFNDPQVISLDALRVIGREYDAAHPGVWEQRIGSAQAGRSRGADLHVGHDRAAEGRDALPRQSAGRRELYTEAFEQHPDDERMCFLPLCHVAERVVGVYTALLSGTRLNFVENPETVPENVREIAPTVFGAVPRIWEKFYSVVTIRVKRSDAARAARLQARDRRRLQGRGLREEGKPVPAYLAAALWLARVLVLNNIRKAIGVHRARLLITGAAPSSPDLIRWYMALGLEMVEVWGQTESGGISTSNPIGSRKAGLDRQAAAADGS